MAKIENPNTLAYDRKKKTAQADLVLFSFFFFIYIKKTSGSGQGQSYESRKSPLLYSVGGGGVEM